MAADSFQALVATEAEGKVQVGIQALTSEALPPGDVLVAVQYSSLNYKDGLAVTGRGKVIRRYPMIPGIDLAGTVLASESSDYKPGDPVVLTGWGVGERHHGGFAQQARVRSEWLVPLPDGLTLHQAMGIGTAGLTAMLCVLALEEHGCRPGGRSVAVTGAAGGVGSVAVALLARLGYAVTAFSGRPEAAEYLGRLGAAAVLDRSLLTAPPAGPLESERWGGAVDTVGGEPLAALLRGMAYGSTVAACGLAAAATLTTTVLPFILRGVTLAGIDSVNCPQARRRQAWQRLAADLPAAALTAVTRTVPLAAVPGLSQEILAGQVRGRIVVDVNA